LGNGDVRSIVDGGDSSSDSWKGDANLRRGDSRDVVTMRAGESETSPVIAARGAGVCGPVFLLGPFPGDEMSRSGRLSANPRFELQRSLSTFFTISGIVLVRSFQVVPRSAASGSATKQSSITRARNVVPADVAGAAEDCPVTSASFREDLAQTGRVD
jgi:hypothetical protein